MPKTNNKERGIRRILVPTDFSDAATSALQYAIEMAKSFKADLVLAHVIEPFPYNLLDGAALVDQGTVMTQTQFLLDKLSKK